ncbi:MAG TPA: ATP-binding protein [Gemmatales bacterium]|nr:ATP-binding protein [Gemmatales bacterium]
MATRTKQADGPKREAPAHRLLAISDTVNGSRAQEHPGEVLSHYGHLAGCLWLPPQLDTFGKSVLEGIGQARTTWASLTGPYGFGKTAAGILLWRLAREAGFLAIPPLSCTNYDEFAAGVAALAAEQLPKEKQRIQKLFDQVWTGGIDRIAKEEAERHDIPVRKLRKVFEAQLEHGRWAPDGHSHRLVEFLARLGQLSRRSSRGLVVIVDELQQLLGPLDVSSLSRLREFVWGMRTEQSSCAVILTLDTQLEMRLAHWAADLLHRVREDSPALQMATVFNRDFPRWLWERLTTPNGRPGKVLPANAMSAAVLDSLGQFVERPDLANGPRTVVDVFNRAVEHYHQLGETYDVLDLVDDLHHGRFRFFGEGAPVQRVLTQLLSDAWIDEDSVRRALVRTLAAYPRGGPGNVIPTHVGNGREIKGARAPMFCPPLGGLPDGLALEPLQQVSRGGSQWENALARCWDSMPAVSALAELVPELVTQVLLPRLFTGLGQPAGEWTQLKGNARTAVSGFQILRGSFDPAFPAREVGVWVGQAEPKTWLDDVDLCIAFVCTSEMEPGVQPTAKILNLEGPPRIILTLPAMVPMDAHVPEEIARYQKYIRPEPLRPGYVLLGLRELLGFDEMPGGAGASNGKARGGADAASMAERRKMASFRELCFDHLLRFLLQGEIDAGIGRPIRQRGPELLRALFSVACRTRFPSYQTLATVRHWKTIVQSYRDAIASEHLSASQRQGQEEVVMEKADAYRLLFKQTSTAAGDSFIRSLGPLAKVTSKGDGWSIRFPLHPGESAVLEYLRSCSRTQAVPVSATAECLRHKGYLEEEASQIVSLLDARGLVVLDRSRGVRLLLGRKGLEEESRRRVLAARDKLARIDETCELPEPLPAKPAEMTRLADELEGRLQSCLESLLETRRRHLETLRAAIGTVRGVTLPNEWLPTSLSTQLAGVADTLRRSQAKLVESLRKEAERIQDELPNSPADRFDWAVRWVRRSESALAQLQKLIDRRSEFETQTTSLSAWVPVNQELYAVSTLCTKIGDTDPAPAHDLARLVEGTREQFSTQSWAPINASREFRAALRSISEDLQGLLYSQARAFYGELEALRQQFGPLLPQVPAPAFEGEATRHKKRRGGYDAFAELYRWALSGFRDVFDRASRLKADGQTWADPRRKKRSWKELASGVEKLLAEGNGDVGIEEVTKAGTLLTEILRGFSETNSGVFDTPAAAPDFDALRERFMRGEVVIRIEPRQ